MCERSVPVGHGNKATATLPLCLDWTVPLQLIRGGMRFRWAGKAAALMATLVLGACLLSAFTFTTLESKYMELLGQQMAERSARVERTCQRHSAFLLQQYSAWIGTATNWSAVNQTLVSRSDLLVHHAHRLVWCKVPKVASTSLVHGFLRVLGRADLISSVPRGSLHTLIRRLLPQPLPGEDLSSFIAFMVIRHPFQRLLSAYRDKFLNRWEHSQFLKFRDQYGSSIIQNYRQHPQKEQYLDVPTFREFVEYLIATPVWKYNEHWRPYYLTCIPCHQRYSVIIKLDSLIQEAKYLVNITGLQELSPMHVHATMNTTYTPSKSGNKPENFELSDFQIQLIHRRDQANGSDSATESMFFSELDMQQLLKLYSVFKIDFEMFDFEISPYDTYVHMNKSHE